VRGVHGTYLPLSERSHQGAVTPGLRAVDTSVRGGRGAQPSDGTDSSDLRPTPDPARGPGWER
jgi:hypothetical protein